DAIWACVIHGTCALSSSPPVRRVFKPVWFGLSSAPITPSPVHSNGLYVRCVPQTGMFGSLLCVNGCCVLASYSPIRFILYVASGHRVAAACFLLRLMPLDAW